MIYLKAALGALNAAGLVTKLVLALGLAGSLLIAYGVWHHKIYRAGYIRALADIAAEDSRAINRATDLRKTWRDCRDRGGHWDQSRGACS